MEAALTHLQSPHLQSEDFVSEWEQFVFDAFWASEHSVR